MLVKWPPSRWDQQWRLGSPLEPLGGCGWRCWIWDSQNHLISTKTTNKNHHVFSQPLSKPLKNEWKTNHPQQKTAEKLDGIRHQVVNELCNTMCISHNDGQRWCNIIHQFHTWRFRWNRDLFISAVTGKPKKNMPQKGSPAELPGQGIFVRDFLYGKFCLFLTFKGGNIEYKIWLVVSTHLKNISQNGNLPQVGVNIKNNWIHHPEMIRVGPIFLGGGDWTWLMAFWDLFYLEKNAMHVVPWLFTTNVLPKKWNVEVGIYTSPFSKQKKVETIWGGIAHQFYMAWIVCWICKSWVFLLKCQEQTVFLGFPIHDESNDKNKKIL